MRFRIVILSFILLVVSRADSQPAPTAPSINMPISPAKEPVPALRWKLLPELRDTTPGNAVVLYYRAFTPEWWGAHRRDQKTNEALSKETSMPLAELRELVEREPSALGWVRESAMLREVERAARRQYCDWDLTSRVREDGIGLLIPDIQHFRGFAQMLAFRCRYELAIADFDKAARTLQTGLSMGRHVSEGPTLIQSLVGTAITAVMLNQVEEWTRTPNSPNLYWALTNLPQPMIDMRKPLQGERMMIDNLLPGFREALAKRSAAPLSRVDQSKLQNQMALLRDGSNYVAFNLIFVMKKYPGAKEFLVSQGWSPEQVDKLPALQAVMLHEVASYDRVYDEVLKWAALPFPLAATGMQRADALVKAEAMSHGSPGMSLAAMLLPATSKIIEAANRVDRRIAALRCVEAIRLYAAEHNQLPKSLADIMEVPIPNDPTTGSPFPYTSDGTAAVLTAPRQPASTSNTFTYAITLRK
jgi:hypothetical protein